MTGAENTLILCDFDGTASPTDVGNRLLCRFAGDGWEEIDREYCAGRIGSRAAYTRIAPLFRGNRAEMLEYVLTNAAMDRDFASFYHLCLQQGIDVKIVSDGLGFYIEALLARHGLAQMDYHANFAVFAGDGSVSIQFPDASADCGRCGNCKRSILKRYRLTYGRIIYIGDGHSDICAARDADLVFAKAVLYRTYATEGQSCIRFERFADVIRSLRHAGIMT